MKKIIRSKIAISLFRLLHPDLGSFIAQKISNTSSHYHHHDRKSIEIRSEIIDFAKHKWDEGYDIVLVGHYHQTGIEQNQEKSLIFMGDWLRHFTVTILDENGWYQNKWEQLQNSLDLRQ